MDRYIKNNAQIKDAVNSYLGLSSQELIIRLGASIISKNCFYGDAPTIGECYNAAIQWVNNNYSKIKEAICNNRSVLRNKRNEAIYAAVDLLISAHGGLPMIFAAIYIIDFGIDKFCTCKEKEFINDISKHFKNKQ